jgi:fructose-1-phosphate kinase PfkB-like protein
MDEKLWKLSLIAKPSFPIVNPIGAGDAVASGTMHCWADALQQKSQLHTFNPVFSSLTNDKLIEDSITSFGWGLACGTSSCATNTNSVFDVQTAVQLFQNFTVEELI